MKNMNLKKIMMFSGLLAICLAFSVADSFGQKSEVFVGSTKSNIKNALTRAETSDDVVKGMSAVARKGKIKQLPTRRESITTFKNERGTYSARWLMQIICR